jgi:hypothetical protein
MFVLDTPLGGERDGPLTHHGLKFRQLLFPGTSSSSSKAAAPAARQQGSKAVRQQEFCIIQQDLTGNQENIPAEPCLEVLPCQFKFYIAKCVLLCQQESLFQLLPVMA